MRVSNSERFYDIIFNPNLIVVQTKKYISRTHYREELWVSGILSMCCEVVGSITTYYEF